MNHEIDRLTAELEVADRQRKQAEAKTRKLVAAIARIDTVLMDPKKGVLAEIVAIVENVREDCR